MAAVHAVEGEVLEILLHLPAAPIGEVAGQGGTVKGVRSDSLTGGEPLEGAFGSDVCIDKRFCVRVVGSEEALNEMVRPIGGAGRLSFVPLAVRVEVFHRGELVAARPLVAPGEVSVVDDHYGGPRRSPARAIRPTSGNERAFLALGEAAAAFLRAAAAAGTNKLGTELAGIVASRRPGGATPWWGRWSGRRLPALPP